MLNLIVSDLRLVLNQEIIHRPDLFDGLTEGKRLSRMSTFQSLGVFALSST